MSHGSNKIWMVEPVEGALNDDDLQYPHSQFISEANGGEMRKSYHGYPKGYAQLIQSPDTFNPVPMQIDTWNREMTNSTFLPGPLPRASRIRDGVAGYNPLLECPCSDRLVKKWGMAYSMDPTKCEGGNMDNATECFTAAEELIPANRVITKMLHNSSLPDGCVAGIDKDGYLHATWNSFCHNKDSKTSTLAELTNNDAETVVGVAKGVVNVTITLDPLTNEVTITMTGPKDKWFGKLQSVENEEPSMKFKG